MSLSHLWIIFILALFQNFDDFMSGVAFGMSKKIFSPRILIPFMLGSTSAMLVAMELGRMLSEFLNRVLTNYLSTILLLGIGIWMIWKTWYPDAEPENSSISSEPHKNLYSFWATYMLGMALGVDDVIEAIGLSMAKFPVLITVLIFKTVQLVAVLCGAQLGSLGISKIKLPNLDFIPGIIIIILGLKQLLL